MRRTALALMLAALGVGAAGAPALAQQGRISGTVTSAEDNRPVVAAQLVVVGAQGGAGTHEDGRYTLTPRPGSYRGRVIRNCCLPDSATAVVPVCIVTTQ